MGGRGILSTRSFFYGDQVSNRRLLLLSSSLLVDPSEREKLFVRLVRTLTELAPRTNERVYLHDLYSISLSVTSLP